jgi:hypothetical protein
MAKRTNTFTRFISDIVDNTKDLADDMLDRAKTVETNAKDAVKDAVDDGESFQTSTPRADGRGLEAPAGRDLRPHIAAHKCDDRPTVALPTRDEHPSPAARRSRNAPPQASR